jgi:four helix bundle protein
MVDFLSGFHFHPHCHYLEGIMGVSSYRDLIVWQKAMDFVDLCYDLTALFPKSEQFNLVSQLQRAAVSVPSNIAEGQGREHTREFINHLSIARGSLYEAETQIQIAERRKYIISNDVNTALNLSAEIARMLHGLIQALERKLG